MPLAARPVPLLAAAPLLVLAGCAAHTPFLCPTRGGAPWRELTSPAFVVRTDLSSADARELTQELERLNAIVATALFRRPPAHGARLQVVVFRNRREFSEFAPTPDTLAYYRIDRRGDEAVVMFGSLDVEARAVIVHELTHRVLARAFVRQPPWFSEGTAVFMESLGKATWQTAPSLGGIPRRIDRGEHLIRSNVGTVLRAEVLTARDYPTAWLLVHYLHNNRAAEFGELQQRFARGEDPAVAWREVFPAWDPRRPEQVATLEQQLRAYLDHGKYGYRPITIPATQVALAERALGPADAHAIRLGLHERLDAAQPDAALDGEIEEALAEDPTHVAVLDAAARRHPQRSLEHARRATQAHAEDARAWRLLAYSLPASDVAARDDALRRSLATEPDHPAALGLLAASLVDQEREGEALPLARRAVELAPWSGPALVTLGGTQAGLGQCAEAMKTLQRALDVVGEARPATTRSIQAELARLRERCPGAPAATPAGARAR